MKMRDHSTAAMPDELVLAIGLIWGHLSVGQFGLARQLARACLRVWPQEEHLMLMDAYAAVELSMPLDDSTLDVLQKTEGKAWAEMVLRRGGIESGAPTALSAASDGDSANAVAAGVRDSDANRPGQK